MQRPDFANETTRLARGFNRDGDLTPERMDALYERFGHLSRDVWRRTVDRCLCADRYPALSALEREAEAQQEYERAAITRRRDEEARQTFQRLGIPPPVQPFELDHRDQLAREHPAKQQAIREFYRLQFVKHVPADQAAEVFNSLVESKMMGEMERDFAARYGHLMFHYCEKMFAEEFAKSDASEAVSE